MSDISPGVVCFITVIGTALFVSIVMNAIVIYLMLSNKKIRNATSLMIANLAVSDIFMAAFILPQNLHDVTHADEFHEGEVACKIVNALPIFCISSAIYTLCAMSIERHRAICNISQHAMTSSTARRVILGVWVLSFFVSMPTMVEYSVYAQNHSVFIPANETYHDRHELEPYIYDGELIASWNRSTWENGTLFSGPRLACGSAEVPDEFSIANGFFLLLVAYIIPLVIICINYARLIFFINSKSNTQPGGEGPHINQSQVSKKRVKVLKMLIIVAALFVMSWMLYFVILIIAKLSGQDDSSAYSGEIHAVKISLSTFSVSYNVYLYLMYNSAFRDGFRRLMCPCVKKTAIAPVSNDTAPNNTASTAK